MLTVDGFAGGIRKLLGGAACAALMIAGTGIIGCGGGGAAAPIVTPAPARAAQIRLNVQWGAATRAAVLAPGTANSIRFTFWQNGVQVGQQDVARNGAEAVVTVDGLPEGNVEVRYAFYAETTPETAAPIAQGNVTVQTAVGVITEVRTFTVGASTDLAAPVALRVFAAASKSAFTVGETATIAASLKDADGNTPDGLAFMPTVTTSNAAVVSVASAGGVLSLTAVGAGTATVTVTEPVSGIHAAFDVTVTAPSTPQPSDPTPVNPTPNPGEPTGGVGLIIR